MSKVIQVATNSDEIALFIVDKMRDIGYFKKSVRKDQREMVFIEFQHGLG